MTSPKVSVIVPVYNAARWLPASFSSFEAQSYASTEWVLVDDGSTDDSAELCADWCGRDSSRRRLVRKENGGASSARNAGLEAATGDFVLFWDCDDEQDPTAIEEMVESVDAPDEVAVCAIRRVHADGNENDLFACKRHAATPEQALDEWLRGGVSTGPYSKLVPRELLLERGIRFEEGVINEDVLWTAEVLAASSRVVLMGDALYHYIAREESVTSTVSPRVADVFDNCRKLEAFICERFPLLKEACSCYCARACWSVALSFSRGGTKKRYPDVYRRAMRELADRRGDVAKYCASPKDRVLRLLVRLRLYGLLKR